MSDEVEATTTHVTNNNVTNYPFSVDWESVGWACAAMCAAAVLCTLIWSIAAYNTNVSDRMAEAIKNGSHPMDVYCAFDGSSEDKVCLVRATLNGKDVK